MEHPGFFDNKGPFSLQEIAGAVKGELAPGSDPALLIRDVRPLDQAGSGDLAFLSNPKYVAALAQTKAAACLIKPDLAGKLPPATAPILVGDPYRAFAMALALFYPSALFPRVISVGTQTGEGNAASYIDPAARLEADVSVQPGAAIGAGTMIGAGTVIAAGAIIGENVSIGQGCFIGPRAVVTHALIGNRVIIHAGVSIGQDGFGFAMGPAGHLKVPQIGRVIIQDDVEIGANSAIDRGALKDTVIGEGTKIDNLVQIAHNVEIGRHCVIVGQTGISGSTVLEDFVVMGGQSGTVGHIRIGAGAQVAGNSGVAESIPARERWGGSPARPLRQWAREVALLKRLSETLSGKALKALKRLGE